LRKGKRNETKVTEEYYWALTQVTLCPNKFEGVGDCSYFNWTPLYIQVNLNYIHSIRLALNSACCGSFNCSVNCGVSTQTFYDLVKRQLSIRYKQTYVTHTTCPHELSVEQLPFTLRLQEIPFSQHSKAKGHPETVTVAFFCRFKYDTRLP